MNQSTQLQYRLSINYELIEFPLDGQALIADYIFKNHKFRPNVQGVEFEVGRYMSPLMSPSDVDTSGIRSRMIVCDLNCDEVDFTSPAEFACQSNLPVSLPVFTLL